MASRCSHSSPAARIQRGARGLGAREEFQEISRRHGQRYGGAFEIACDPFELQRTPQTEEQQVGSEKAAMSASTCSSSMSIPPCRAKQAARVACGENPGSAAAAAALPPSKYTRRFSEAAIEQAVVEIRGIDRSGKRCGWTRRGEQAQCGAHRDAVGDVERRAVEQRPQPGAVACVEQDLKMGIGCERR
jgi:hypothetical protein